MERVKPTIIATSGSAKGIIKLMNDFYYSTSFTFSNTTGEVSNCNGVVKNVEVVQNKKGRFIFRTKMFI